MANLHHLASKLFKWEGGYVSDPDDHGGPTNMGITISTWRKVGYDKDGNNRIDIDDIRLLTPDDAMDILRKFYWNRWHADDIISQPVADILVDWVWASGIWGIIIPQRLLHVPDDGIVGPVTLKKVNTAHVPTFMDQLYTARLNFIHDIIRKNPSQKKFEPGWLNRLNDFKLLPT